MRGEETQVFGALSLFGVEDGLFVLPGTHSKWVMAGSGGISGFSTYMTGEMFAAARDHTILGRLMEPGPFAEEAFLKGVRDGSYPGEPGSLLHRLFSRPDRWSVWSDSRDGPRRLSQWHFDRSRTKGRDALV